MEVSMIQVKNILTARTLSPKTAQQNKMAILVQKVAVENNHSENPSTQETIMKELVVV